MMRLALAGVAGVLAIVSALAAPTDTAIVAAMKLPDFPNYSWVSEIVDDARSYEVVGKTDRATDYSLVTMPMVGAVRRRAVRGSSGTDNQATALFRGAERFVLQTDNGWRLPEEMPAMAARSSRGGSPGGGYPGGGFPGGMRGRGRRGGGPFPSEDGSPPTPAYSNLQQTLSRPHEEIAIIVAGYTELKAEEGGVFSGTLNETAAKLLLVHAGQNEITPLRASGTFRLWIANGTLVKYETKLEGTLQVETRSAKHEVVVHQRSTTTLKDAGATTFEVPDEARKKLGA
ncbi:MAG: hypothetical protein HZA93_14610 [Verrucomicrobia bacterium]|nr:hypothetical protein [Verrucomicrobiota bacterium]